MKYIKKLIINNFQSHKYSELDFAQDLNVIIGPSDSGKTAIIRALKWVLYNEPSGDFFIREGESEVSVTIILSDETSLKRYRSKSKNGYQLVTSDGEEAIFEGIGVSVPQEIIDITGISKMHLDGDHSNAINLGEQLEGPFLLSEKTSTRANAIGRLVGVDIIDEALREVLKDIRNLNLRKNSKEESIQELSKSIEKYDYLDDLKAKHRDLKIILSKIKEYDKKRIRLEDIKNRYNKLEINSLEIRSILLKLDRIDTLDKISNTIKSKLLDYNKYNYLRIKIIDIIKTKYDNNLILSKLMYINDVDNKLPKLTEMNKKYKLLNSLRTEFDSINKSKMLISRDIDSCKLVDDADNTINAVLSKANIYYKLLIQNKELLDKQASLKKGKVYLANLSPLINQEDNIIACAEKITLLLNLEKKYDNLKSIKALNAELTSSLDKNNKALKVTLLEYSNILEKVGKCPYCLSVIDDTAIKHVIDYHIGG